MSYQSLYRKWRPQNFEDLVGQDHISSTLANAIAENKLSHAFLFCGPRGTGKTSTARILAKALNCEKGPTPTPCNKCKPCIQITDGSFLDVLEIDAASNRGIDEIRNLKENARYTASGGKKRVYIIDEVHMLTTEAFNALLKLLEEPPSHLVLILATTEPHKVLTTIASRCQRFEFRPISSGDITKRLTYIAQNENIQLEEEAALHIAEHANGGLRDALSLLEQLIVYCGSEITADKVKELTGTVDIKKLFEAVEAIKSNKRDEAIIFVNSLILSGVDLKNFTLNLAKTFRNILISESSAALAGLADINNEAKETLKSYLNELGSDAAANIALRLHKSLYEFAQGDNRLTLEMLLLDCQRIASSPTQAVPVNGSKTSVVNSSTNDELAKLKQRISILEKSITPVNEHVATKKDVKITNVVNDDQHDIQPVSSGSKTKTDDPVPSNLTINEITSMWQEILRAVRTKKSTTHALLIECQPVSLEDGSTICLEFKQRAIFHKTSLEKAPHADILKSAIAQTTGKTFSIKCVLATDEPDNSKHKTMKVADSIKNKITQNGNKEEGFKDKSERPSDSGDSENSDPMSKTELIEFLQKEFDAELIE